jgi:autotransporter-associated beta strand protein
MKLKRSSIFISAAILASLASSNAQVIRAANADNLNLGTAWVAGTAPSGTTVATWDASSTLANTMGAALTWGGLNISAASGTVTISGANNLTFSTPSTINTGSSQNLTIGNKDAGTLALSGVTLTGSTRFTFNKTTDTGSASFNSANALNFTGTLALRGGTPSSAPGTMQGGTGRFWISSLTGTQAAGTAFALDTGASTSDGQDFIIGDWDGTSGNRKLTLSSLTGFGTIRTDAGGDGTRNLIVNQSTNTTFNGMMLAHGTASASRKIAFQKDGAGQLTLAGIVGLETAGAAGTLANHTVTVDVKGGTLVMTANNTTTGTLTVRNGGTLKMQNANAGSNFTGGNASMTGSYTVDAGGKLQGFRNGSAAFGTGGIILNGGTLAQEQGNWTWTNNITLSTATTSTLESQSPNTGTRALKIQGTISGSGNLGFSDTTGGMGLDTGFIFTGANTMSGTVTIGTGLKLRVGGVTGSDSSLNAGTGGSLGTASVVNDGTLTFSHSDAWSVANIISGTGAVRVGSTGISGSGTQSLTLSSTNTYTGGTTVNAGTLILGHATDTLADSGALAISGGICDIGSNNDTVGAVSLTGGTLTGATGVLSGSAFSVSAGTVSAILGGTGNLTKNTAGTVTLSRANTYTGTTLVLEGALVVNGSIASGSAVTVASGATLTGTGSLGGAVTVETGTAAITGGDGTSGVLTVGSLAFDGSGVVNIGSLTNYTSTAAVNVTGGLTLNGGAGAVTINMPAGIIGAGTYHLISHANTLADTSGFMLGIIPALSTRQTGTLQNNPGSLDYVVSGVNPTWTGLLSGAWSTATLAAPKNWALPGGGTTDYLGGDVVLFDDTAAGTKTVNIASDVAPTAVTFNNSAVNYSLTGTGGIAGVAGVTKSGTGTLSISSPNTYTGGTVISGGTIAISDDASLGDVTGNLTYSGNGTLRLNAGFDTYRSQVINSGVSATIDTNGFNLVQNDGAISGDGTLVKNGAGTLDLLNNTYTGGTILNAGTLTVANSSSLGATTGPLSFSGNGTLLVGGTINSTRPYSISGGVTATIDTNSNTLTQGGVVSGTGTLNKDGLGMLAMTGNSTFSGPITVSAGTLKFSGSGAVASTSLSIATGATFEWARDAAVSATLTGAGTVLRSSTAGNAVFSGVNTSFTGDWNITSGYVGLTNDDVVGASTVGMTWNGGGIFFTATGNTLSATRTITLGASGGILNGSTGNTNTFASKFTGAGNLNKVSGERAILTAVNDFTGNISISGGGTLEIGGAGRFGSGTYAGAISNANTFAVNTTANQTLSGVISGAGGLTKANSGTLVIDATNTLSGNVAISGGTVVVNSGKSLAWTAATKTGANSLVISGGAVLELAAWGAWGPTGPLGQLNYNDGYLRMNAGTIRLAASDATLANRGINIDAGGATLEAASGVAWSMGGGSNALHGTGTLTLTGNGGGTVQTAITTSGGLIKSGSGTWSLTGANTYTGDTVVNGGTLAVNGTAIADANKLVISGGKVQPTGTETVNTLFFGAAQQASGTWGATGSGATHIDDTRFSGTGKVNVVAGPPSGYSTWAALNAGGQDPDQDTDGDGVSNGIEYFMGETGSSFTANPGVVGGTVTWPRDPLAVASFKVQVSETLASWTDINPPDPAIDETNPNQVIFTLPTGSSKKFCRLVVTP